MTKREAVGFYWSYRYGAKYCVVILDCSRRKWVRTENGRVKRMWCREFKADTVRELREMAAPYRLGRNVKRLCLSKVHDA